MQGGQHFVYVRGHGGGLRRLALLEAGEGLAFVCAPESYDAIVRGLRERPIFGFPLADVFWADDGFDAPDLKEDDPRARVLEPVAP